MTEIMCWSCEREFILEDISDPAIRKEAEAQMMCANCLHKQEARNESEVE